MTLDAEDPNWPELLSHPVDDGRDETVLERHLLTVAGRAREVTPEDTETACGRPLHDAAALVGLAHDFGKATTMFQTHIGNDSGDEEPSHHARLGGLIAYYALSRMGYGPKTCFAGLVAVAKHHGTLPNAESFVSTGLEQDGTWECWDDNRAGYNGHARQQAANIEEHHPEFARAVVDRLVGEEGCWSEFLGLLGATEPGDADDPSASLRDCLRERFMYERRRYQPDSKLFDDGETYLDALRLYGTLTFADKTHAAGVTDDDERIHADQLDPSQVWNHIETLGVDDADPDALEARLNEVRSTVQDHIGGRRDGGDPVAEFLGSDRDVATLTLPTGYGKTLTGLLAAARIRAATGGDRIVYALPFTSVIDQTAAVFDGLLGGGPDDSDAADLDESDPATGRRLTKHHHLSEALTLPNDDEDEPTTEEPTDEEMARATMLAESWRAGVTLTTFVQLFESLAGPSNTQSMKLPALYDSVVIVDEPQALPLPWWPLVARLVEALADEYGATVVLMTATQPRIVDDERTVPLLDSETLATLERETDSDLPDRVEYEFHPTALETGDDDADVVDYETAATSLVERVTGTTESVLAICNTIDSTGDLFDAVTGELENRSETAATDDGFVDVATRFEAEIVRDDTDRIGVPPTDDAERYRAAFVRGIAETAGGERPAVLFLSTRLRPCDRRFLLTVAEELTAESIPTLLVSTQLVEAGVDVSFDRVYRDFAPLDSIVQAAGRCNRSFERAPEAGEVSVWRLAVPEGSETLPSEAVYARRDRKTDMDLLERTRTALADVPVGEAVPESGVAEDAVETYHDLVGETVETMADDNDLLTQFRRAEGDELRTASLIDSPFSFEVYVCRNEAEYDRVEEYRVAERNYEFDEMERLKSQLGEIRVSVPAYRRDSDTARKLTNLKPLSHDGEKRDATERVLRPDDDPSFFDAQTGVDVPESTVDARIL
ncbi:CRISPR-associated endonuclease Cas3'' [Halosimplex rubrum]|uniref:CRISPR-associated endonuclease Cas3 n=1 Tax=Halosimplex rubrum TaxID=869889 RepID=A0A7D5PAD6_9EURY|nr:CRISPR-associated endonuclease Cas3'' [Halosimplex rubrum]QLH77559.1 CRISPR-associated endonuclease Cas3'' [Halosimplex rubrum]